MGEGTTAMNLSDEQRAFNRLLRRVSIARARSEVGGQLSDRERLRILKLGGEPALERVMATRRARHEAEKKAAAELEETAGILAMMLGRPLTQHERAVGFPLAAGAPVEERPVAEHKWWLEPGASPCPVCVPDLPAKVHPRVLVERSLRQFGYRIPEPEETDPETRRQLEELRSSFVETQRALFALPGYAEGTADPATVRDLEKALEGLRETAAELKARVLDRRTERGSR